MAVLLGASWAVYAVPGDVGTIMIWDLVPGCDAVTLVCIGGEDPHETIADPLGLTAHVGAPANATSMENTCGGSPGFCGPLYWNPMTDDFKTYCVTGGVQVGGDLNESAAPVAGSDGKLYSPGDFWMTVRGNGGFSPYVNFKGSDSFRRYTLGPGLSTSVSVRHSPLSQKVYVTDFGFPGFSPGEVYELDPLLSMARKWTIGNHPYFAADDHPFVYVTAPAGGGFPDQIVRIDTLTPGSPVLRWTIPFGGLQAGLSLGTPNFISKDDEGNFWFTESASDQLGRLSGGPDMVIGTADDVICEYNKPTPGIDNPHSIASSGVGALLQAFFTEASPAAPGAAHISLLTEADATDAGVKVCATVAPASSTVAPTPVDVELVDFTLDPRKANIPPSEWTSTGVDPSGFTRFPIPGGVGTTCVSGPCTVLPESSAEPTGMTAVVFSQTVHGSMEGSDHVFELVSPAIIVEVEGEKVTGGGGYLTSPSTATFGFNAMKDAAGNIKCELEFRHHGNGDNVHIDSCSSLICSDTNGNGIKDTCNFKAASGTYKSGGGSGVPLISADVEVKDFKEPGKGIDEFHITYLPTGAGGSPSGGVLKMGNIQIHPPKTTGS
jgi:hypothetical protein